MRSRILPHPFAKFAALFILSFSLFGPLRALEPHFVVTSPDEGKTWPLAEISRQKLYWSKEKQMLFAQVTFSNARYASSTDPASEETFRFLIPGIVFDTATGQFFWRDTEGRTYIFAELRKYKAGKVIDFSSIQPVRHSLIRVKRVGAAVNVVVEWYKPDDVAKEMQAKQQNNDPNATTQEFSLQSLLPGGP